MGNSCHQFDQCLGKKHEVQFQDKTLKVVTLNYGGVLKNPFEFYSDDQAEEKKLSNTFLSLLPLYIKDYNAKQFQWDIGKIDLKLQTERYSPLYNPSVGIDKNKKRFNSAKDFQKHWDQQYHDATKKNKIQPQPTEKQKQNMKLFDLICYHSILVNACNFQCDKKLNKVDLSNQQLLNYQNFMKKKFSKSFLNEQKKLQKVIKLLNTIDIAFVQQSTDLLINKVKNDQRFILKEKGDGNSMIIVRKQKFIDKNQLLKLKSLQLLEQKGQFNFNGHDDVVYLCLDKLILISTHLSSKETKNLPQVKAMKLLLNKLSKEFKGFKIILGADANSYVDSEGFNKQFSIFPANSSVITTRKKRTYLQPQYKKADKVIESCKDHIITTLPILNQSVQTIDQKYLTGKQMLPTDQHPFDHFMVMCQLRKN